MPKTGQSVVPVLATRTLVARTTKKVTDGGELRRRAAAVIKLWNPRVDDYREDADEIELPADLVDYFGNVQLERCS